MLRRIWNYLLRIFLIVLCSFNFITNVYSQSVNENNNEDIHANDSGLKVKWGYKGNKAPMRWGQLNPAFLICAKGKLQSPININQNNKIKIIINELIINYQSAPMEII